MSDKNSISVDPSSILQVQHVKISNLTQTNTLLEARMLEMQAEIDQLQSEIDRLNKELTKNFNSDLVKTFDEDITA